MSERCGPPASVKARSAFLDQIKDKQFKNTKLSKICEKFLQGEAKVSIHDNEDV